MEALLRPVLELIYGAKALKKRGRIPPVLPGLFVTDFDGTVTQNDFFRLVVEQLSPGEMDHYWQGYLNDRFSHFEALQGIFGSIRVSEDRLLALVEQVQAEPNMAEWVERLQAAGWEVVVASAGCAWYIERTLDRLGVQVEVHANPGTFHPGHGLQMHRPTDSPFYSPTHGIDKAAIVRAGLARGQVVAFAGDGFPDLPAARLVPSTHRFARHDLRVAMQRERLAFVPFERWSEVAGALCERFNLQGR
jgi:2,3-diketo-5-methylthio-1-phosphopentane phosphatase